MSEVLANGRTRICVAGLTDVGRQRKHNEDNVLVKAELRLFAVADGMGGHNAGEVASSLVVTSLANFFEATASGSPVGDLPDEYRSLDPAGKRIAAGVRKANHDVFTVSNTNHAHHGMGSTCVALHLDEEFAYIAHVGDSRCYRIRDGEIQQMTRDHSLINDALDMKPDLTKEELSRLPKNIITRALGMKDGVKVDVRTEPVLPGDVFLLCSDGLSGLVPPEQILEVVGLTSEPQEACELLIAEANDAGGNDNISALIVRVDDADADADEIGEEVAIEGDAELAAAATEPDHAGEIETAEEELDPELLEAAHTEPPPPAPPPIPPPPPVPVVAPAAARAPAAPTPSSIARDLQVALARAGEVDLELRGRWATEEPAAVQRCGQCQFEIFPGNYFCVECGARLENPIP